MGQFPITPEAVSSPAAPQSVRTLLVGTALSIAQLEHTLAIAQPPLTVVGCLLPTGAGDPAEAGVQASLLGDLAALAGLVETDGRDFDQVLVSLPLAMQDDIRDASQILDRSGITWRFLPTLTDQLAGLTTGRGDTPAITPVGSHMLTPSRPVDLAQLIDRRPRPLDESAIRDCLTGRTVLITGAGGSIGSELANVVARFQPARLILVERSENAIFEIDREIGRVFPDVPREAVLHDITRRDRTFDLFERLKPDVVFHAAAHKHVPMMECHPAEAVENNFYGTRSVADAADHVGCDKFVMISTDKAVNPSSVMGATKRLAELYIRYLNGRSDCTYSMVRFGNVLGSACSVLTIWSKQLRQGGPVTVTHPGMTRYFMTIPEAAGLVLQAGALSGECAVEGETVGGEVFLLDMGEPLRILDLAHRFLRLQGFEPNVDVDVKVTGTRPGEKLFEELAYHSEDMTPTPHDSIRIWKTEPTDAAQMTQILATFDRLRDRSDDGSRLWRDATAEAIVTALRAHLPEMVAAAA